MVDVLSPEQRSRCMSNIRGKDTKPEMIVRRIIHNMGYRYRLHRRDLPGSPDLVFAPRKKVIFVHGCFWHQHDCPDGTTSPKTNVEFWSNKLKGNVLRDKTNYQKLFDLNWDTMIIWECWTKKKNIESLIKKIREFLDT